MSVVDGLRQCNNAKQATKYLLDNLDLGLKKLQNGEFQQPGIIQEIISHIRFGLKGVADLLEEIKIALQLPDDALILTEAMKWRDENASKIQSFCRGTPEYIARMYPDCHTDPSSQPQL